MSKDMIILGGGYEKKSIHVATIAEPESAYIVNEDMPPPPDNFPDGWENEWQPSFDDAAIAFKPAPKSKKDEPVTPTLVARTVTALAQVEETEPAEVYSEAVIPSLYVPLVKEDKERDKRRIDLASRAR